MLFVEKQLPLFRRPLTFKHTFTSLSASLATHVSARPLLHTLYARLLLSYCYLIIIDCFRREWLRKRHTYILWLLAVCRYFKRYLILLYTQILFHYFYFAFLSLFGWYITTIFYLLAHKYMGIVYLYYIWCFHILLCIIILFTQDADTLMHLFHTSSITCFAILKYFRR